MSSLPRDVSMVGSMACNRFSILATLAFRRTSASFLNSSREEDCLGKLDVEPRFSLFCILLELLLLLLLLLVLLLLLFSLVAFPKLLNS